MYNYYPCLISKEGEIEALQKLEQKYKNTTSPIIDLIPSGGVDLSALAKKIKAHWIFDGNQLLIDYNRFDTRDQLTDAYNLLKSFKSFGVNAIPVVTLNSPDLHLDLAKRYVKEKKSGLAIRVSSKSTSLININSSMADILKKTGVTQNKGILILDFGYLQEGTVPLVSAFAINTLKSLPDTKAWKAAVILGGSFPKDLSDFEPSDTPYFINRPEGVIYSLISEQLKFVKYGDYGTKHPDYLPSAEHTASCSVKYSTENRFMIYRGKIATNHPLGNGQYIEHCKKLIQQEQYIGEQFSWGDGEVKRISKENINSPRPRTGNPKTWVTISWSHHMTLMNSLLSS